MTFDARVSQGTAAMRRAAREALPDPTQPLSRLSMQELLHGSVWYAALEPGAQSRVLADVAELHVPLGHSLSRYGETPSHWYGVLEGLLKWSVTSPQGRTLTFGGLSVGSWFGEGSLMRGTPRQADLVALRHSRVAALPRETFFWLQRTQPVFKDFLLQQINERLHWFMGDCAARSLQGVEHQVARALVGLFHPLLQPRSDKHLRISQEEIANLSGVSRQRCNRALADLREAGFIGLEYGGITLLDLEGLRASVG